MRGKAVCRNCVEQKTALEGSYIPCLRYKKELLSGNVEDMKELLCQEGASSWCWKFCNMTDRQVKVKLPKQLPVIITAIEQMVTGKKV